MNYFYTHGKLSTTSHVFSQLTAHFDVEYPVSIRKSFLRFTLPSHAFVVIALMPPLAHVTASVNALISVPAVWELRRGPFPIQRCSWSNYV